ncbi:MAG: hypothetical protein GY941_08725, partial [Planctomycetes bacterium]|nr:hypothetical protein [Planctomycetota bacterium]
PGLSGAFLFDDFSNLSQLGAYGTIDNPKSFWLYLTSGFSGPTGRPLSMLTFLLDARDWPADPEAFKRTNVLIHLLTGLVLFALVQQLTRALDYAPAITARVALLTAAVWLLHPLWVSTTLYIVQRMAQLSTLFVLLGLWLYVRTRLQYLPRLSRGTILGSATAIVLIGLLALLSKENGALLPLLAIMVEITLLARYDRTHGRTCSIAFGYWRFVLLGLPTLLLSGYLALRLEPLLAGNPGLRDFTPGERLLTQGRILWDYLFHLILPRSYSGGLFNDDVVLSKGLFTPWYTAPAWAAWLASGVWAWRTRLKYPATALAILFFLTAHILESSFLQLELYFEHRNYLPATLLALPLALWWVTAPLRLPIKRMVVLGLLLALAMMTGLRADLWGRPFQQAFKWAQISPRSARAQHYLAEKMREINKLSAAEQLNARAMQLAPNNLITLIQAVALDCQQGKDASSSIHAVVSTLAYKTKIGVVERNQVAQMLGFLLAGSCGRNSRPDMVLALIQQLSSAERAAKDPALSAILAQSAGTALLQQDKHQAALVRFRQSSTLSRDPGRQLRNAATLASHGAYKEALELLDTTPLRANVSMRWGMRDLYTDSSGYFQREKVSLRERIASDYSNEAQADPPTKPQTTGNRAEIHDRDSN